MHGLMNYSQFIHMTLLHTGKVIMASMLEWNEFLQNRPWVHTHGNCIHKVIALSNLDSALLQICFQLKKKVTNKNYVFALVKEPRIQAYCLFSFSWGVSNLL